jgi:CO/xanthine dehydrogenase Mo-binding subunit
MLVSVMNIPSYYAHAAQVHVDRSTGQVTIQDYVAVHDCGRILDPPYARGQIEGGVVQGVGQALLEELTYDQAMPTNPTLVDYKVPTCEDVPVVRTVFVETKTAAGAVTEPKGVGEPAVIPPGAVVANAVADAVGARVSAMPVTAERCWTVLEADRSRGTE